MNKQCEIHGCEICGALISSPICPYHCEQPEQVIQKGGVNAVGAAHGIEQEDWEEEFGNLVLDLYHLEEGLNNIKDFIAKEKAKSGIEQLEWLLKHASGGGNWRRIALEAIEKLTEK